MLETCTVCELDISDLWTICLVPLHICTWMYKPLNIKFSTSQTYTVVRHYVRHLSYKWNTNLQHRYVFSVIKSIHVCAYSCTVQSTDWDFQCCVTKMSNRNESNLYQDHIVSTTEILRICQKILELWTLWSNSYHPWLCGFNCSWLNTVVFKSGPNLVGNSF